MPAMLTITRAPVKSAAIFGIIAAIKLTELDLRSADAFLVQNGNVGKNIKPPVGHWSLCYPRRSRSSECPRKYQRYVRAVPADFFETCVNRSDDIACYFYGGLQKKRGNMVNARDAFFLGA